MARADWRLEGEWIKSCNCTFGCPCDFNARPTHGECRGFLGMRISSTGAIKFETHGSHATLAKVVQTPEGVAA